MISRFFTAWLIASTIAFGAALAATPSKSDKPAPPKTPSVCWSFKKEARYLGLGFRHFVEITNDCDNSISCVVSTNVNPAPQSVAVDAHSKKEIMTYLDSPASEFSAKVDCTVNK